MENPFTGDKLREKWKFFMFWRQYFDNFEYFSCSLDRICLELLWNTYTPFFERLGKKIAVQYPKIAKFRLIFGFKVKNDWIKIPKKKIFLDSLNDNLFKIFIKYIFLKILRIKQSHDKIYKPNVKFVFLYSCSPLIALRN